MIMENGELVPDLRFPEFRDKWQLNKLDKYCNFTQGVQIPQSEQISELKDKYIRYLYIRDFFSDSAKCYVKDKYPNKIIRPHEIMMVNTGNTAGKAFRGKRGVLSNNSFKISFNQNEIDSNFLFLRLTSFEIQNQIRRFFNTAGQPHLGHTNISQVKIGITCLKEQQKIANFLTAIDQRINLLKEKKAALEDYKKGLMQKIFSQEIRFTDDEGNDFPGWEVNKLGEIAKFSKGKGLSKNDISDSGINKCIRYGELYTRYSEVIDEVHSKTDLDISKCITSHKNDVIIPSSGETQLDIATASCVLNDGIIIGGDLNIIRTEINGVFLAYYLNNFKKLKIAALSQGSSVIHLYVAHLKALKIDIPCQQEQQKIANFLSTIDQKIKAMDKQIADSVLFKKGLLQRMFV